MNAPSDLPEGDISLVEEIMEAHEFDRLKETQHLAFQDGILDGGNHLLVAETGTSKSSVSLELINAKSA